VTDVLHIGRRRNAVRGIHQRDQSFQTAEFAVRHAAAGGVTENVQHPLIVERIIRSEFAGDGGSDTRVLQLVQKTRLRRGNVRGACIGRRKRFHRIAGGQAVSAAGDQRRINRCRRTVRPGVKIAIVGVNELECRLGRVPSENLFRGHFGSPQYRGAQLSARTLHVPNSHDNPLPTGISDGQHNSVVLLSDAKPDRSGQPRKRPIARHRATTSPVSGCVNLPLNMIAPRRNRFKYARRPVRRGRSRPRLARGWCG
jgi:hypothetical protein